MTHQLATTEAAVARYHAAFQQEHRLVYRIADDTVQIAQCRYHYE